MMMKLGAAFALLCAAGFGCMGSDLGVEGGSGALSQKFPGIDSATVISPSAVTVKWTPLSNYTNYNVYISTQDAPIGSSVFNTFAVTGLKPGTAYSFSVAGTSSNGAQDGIGKQIDAQTWTPFLGVTSAAVKDSADVNLVWKYFQGPTFQIFYNIGAPPTADQLEGIPSASSQSATGATVGGLQPNTTYYFSVIAKYPDGTSTIKLLSQPTATLTAQYTSSSLIQSSLPTITTPATLITGNAAVFTVAGGADHYKLTSYDPSLTHPSSSAPPLPLAPPLLPTARPSPPSTAAARRLRRALTPLWVSTSAPAS